MSVSAPGHPRPVTRTAALKVVRIGASQHQHTRQCTSVDVDTLPPLTTSFPRPGPGSPVLVLHTMQYNGLGSTPSLATLATLRDSYSALLWSGPHVHSSVYVTLDTLIPPPAQPSPASTDSSGRTESWLLYRPARGDYSNYSIADILCHSSPGPWPGLGLGCSEVIFTTHGTRLGLHYCVMYYEIWIF